jgi:hypothetical protein
MAGKSNRDDASTAAQEPVEGKPLTAWLIPAITAAALALAFCAYYFVYVGARREYLANRNFRALAALGEHLQQSVSIHGSILEFCADLLAHKKQAAHLDTLGADSFLIVRPEDEKLADADKEREALKDYLKFLAPTFELNEVRSEDSSASLHVERHNDRWDLVLRSFQHGGTGKNYQGSLQIDELMKPLVGSLPFDDILLVSQEGFIVYQQKHTGPQFTTLGSLLQAQVGTPVSGTPATGTADQPDAAPSAEPGAPEQRKKSGAVIVKQNADPAWRSRSMHLTELMLAGTRYKLFLQPVVVATYRNVEDRAEPASEWVLCGIRSSSTLDWEALSLSYTFFIWFTVIFFVIWTGYKALKIIFMNNRERLRLRELGTLGLSLVFLTSVMTLSALELDFHINDDTDDGLRRLGRSLSGNIHDEMQQMSAQLISWCGSGELQGPQGDLNRVSRVKREIIRNTQQEAEGQPLHGTRVAAAARPNEYPFTSNVFWTDDDGHQIVKWGTTRYVTPMIDVSALPVFVRPATHFESGAPAFQFSSILPPNKLDYLANLGMSTTDCALASPTKRLDPGISADVAGGMAVLSAPPLSLIDPILPYGYGFALVDETGTVLFHSDKTRNGLENFLTESDGSKELYAAVFSHASQRSLPIKYLGHDCRALVVPVERVSQAPWSLIVFRDLTAFQTLNVQVMTMASTLLFLVLAGPVLLVGIRCAVLRPRFAPEWLWPNQARSATYVHQVYVYALLIVVFLMVAAWGSTETLLIACGTVPFAALPATLWCFRVRRPVANKLGTTEKSGPGVDAYRARFLAGALLLLLLFGVLMPMALFRASLDVERRLGIKQTQLHLASAVAERWTAIVAQHEKAGISDAAWSAFGSNPQPWHWIWPDSLNTVREPPNAPRLALAAAEHFSSWFRSLLYSFHHNYNDASAEMLGLIRDQGNPADWSWENLDASITLRWHGPHPPAQGADGDLFIASAVPNFSWRDGLTYTAIAAVVMFAAGGLVWILARRLFLFAVAPLKIVGKRQVAESLREGRSVLILLPPVSDWQLDARKKTVDVSSLRTLPQWNEAMADLLSTPANTVIELNRFEYCADDPEVAAQKLAALDRLVKAGNTQVAVVMTVPASSEDYRGKFPGLDLIDLRDEPFPWLKQYEGPAQELIWNECGPMAALWPLGAQLAKDLKTEEDATEDTVVSEILERADGYYKMIWRECSDDQKFVLSQLASDGLLNPTNGRAIRQLVRRGLITMDPQFRIMNESFRRFLRSATTTQLKHAWLIDSRRSGWGRAQGAFFITMTFLGLFLLATQNALWQSAAAYVTTALGGLGTLAKLFDMLRGKVTPEKS